MQEHPLYIASFIAIIVIINVALASLTWFCFNSLSNFIDIQPIAFSEAFLFVLLFRVLEWAKQTILELIFEYE